MKKKTLFFILTQVLRMFLLLPILLSLPMAIGAIKLQDPFVPCSLKNGIIPLSLLGQLSLDECAIPWGRKSQGKVSVFLDQVLVPSQHVFGDFTVTFILAVALYAYSEN